MASKDVADSSVTASAVAAALPFDRMAALGKWIVAKADEMHQLDARIERRLEHLQRSEESLRTLCETVRQQVVSAQDAAAALETSRTLAAERTASEIAALREAASLPSAAEQRLQKSLAKAAVLSDSLDSHRENMQQNADAIVDQTADRLDHLFKSAYELRTLAVHQEFEKRSSELVESIRRSATEQVERLASQAAVAVEPILQRIARQQDQAEAQLRVAVESAEDSLRRRAEQLCRVGDVAVDALEQRMARRIENVRPRTEQAIAAAERTLQQAIAAMTGSSRDQLTAAQNDLLLQAEQLRPRLAELTQQAQDELVEHLARLEEHTFNMTGWLEQRMGERVDQLVIDARKAIVGISGQATPIDSDDSTVFADEYSLPTPKLKLSMFVDRNTRLKTSAPLLQAS